MARRSSGMSVLICALAAHSLLFALLPPISAAEEENATSLTHEEAMNLATEDAVLKEQITQIDQAAQNLHHQIAQLRATIQGTASEAQKAQLYAELDGMQKELRSLERLLHDLLDEAKATEWTTIDEALKQAKRFERMQERVYERQEVIRDRQQ